MDVEERKVESLRKERDILKKSVVENMNAQKDEENSQLRKEGEILSGKVSELEQALKKANKQKKDAEAEVEKFQKIIDDQTALISNLKNENIGHKSAATETNGKRQALSIFFLLVRPDSFKQKKKKIKP